MKTLGLLAATAAISLFGASAQAAVLTFDGDICGGGTSCSDSERIDATYGDITDVIDVQYADDNPDSGDGLRLQAASGSRAAASATASRA